MQVRVTVRNCWAVQRAASAHCTGRTAWQHLLDVECSPTLVGVVSLLPPGVLFGDRVVKYHDTITFADNKNGLRCAQAQALCVRVLPCLLFKEMVGCMPQQHHEQQAWITTAAAARLVQHRQGPCEPRLLWW